MGACVDRLVSSRCLPTDTGLARRVSAKKEGVPARDQSINTHSDPACLPPAGGNMTAFRTLERALVDVVLGSVIHHLLGKAPLA